MSALVSLWGVHNNFSSSHFCSSFPVTFLGIFSRFIVTLMLFERCENLTFLSATAMSTVQAVIVIRFNWMSGTCLNDKNVTLIPMQSLPGQLFLLLDLNTSLSVISHTKINSLSLSSHSHLSILLAWHFHPTTVESLDMFHWNSCILCDHKWRGGKNARERESKREEKMFPVCRSLETARMREEMINHW